MNQRRNSYSYTDNTDIKGRQKLTRRLEQTSRLRCVQSFSPKSRQWIGLHVKTWQNQINTADQTQFIERCVSVPPTQSQVTEFERNLRIVINTAVSGVRNALNIKLSSRKKCLLTVSSPRLFFLQAFWKQVQIDMFIHFPNMTGEFTGLKCWK